MPDQPPTSPPPAPAQATAEPTYREQVEALSGGAHFGDIVSRSAAIFIAGEADAALAAALRERDAAQQGITEALAMVDEAYRATGFVKLAETSVQRLRLLALSGQHVPVPSLASPAPAQSAGTAGEAVSLARHALRQCIEAIEKHDRWCGHLAGAPGDGIINRAPKSAKAALAALDALPAPASAPAGVTPTPTDAGAVAKASAVLSIVQTYCGADDGGYIYPWVDEVVDLLSDIIEPKPPTPLPVSAPAGPAAGTAALADKWTVQATESREEAGRIRRTVKAATDAEMRCLVRAEVWDRCATELRAVGPAADTLEEIAEAIEAVPIPPPPEVIVSSVDTPHYAHAKGWREMRAAAARLVRSRVGVPAKDEAGDERQGGQR